MVCTLENSMKLKARPRSPIRVYLSLLISIPLLALIIGISSIPHPKLTPTPTIEPTPTATLPPQLLDADQPIIKADNARQVVSLAWLAHCGTGLSLTWSPDGKTLALVGSGSVAGNVCLYDTQALDAPPRLLGGPGAASRRSIAFSPDGKKVASGGDDGLIWIW